MSANSVDSDQYVDGSIDLIHMSANSVDSDQYVDGSIDTVHLADDAVTGAKLADNIDIAGTLDVTGILTADSNVVVAGNLTVNGTTTTLNTATLDVEDKNITINYGAGDTSASANGAGITIQDAIDASNDATILWDTTNDEFDFSHAINVTGNIAVSGTVDGRDVATDGTKLDGIEASATADQTAAEIRTAVEAATDSNVFTDADHTKLNAIEALADVTDATNVTAAGALMDSELTSIASVKALNQGVATTDSPTFVNVTGTSLDISGDIDVDGTTNLDVVDIDGALTQDGGAVFNEASADVDFRVESDNDANALFVQGSDGFVGIGTASPAAKLQVGWGSDQLQFTNPTAGKKRIGATYTGYVSDNIHASMDLQSAGSSGGDISFNTTPSGGSLTERLRIDEFGNVLVGTTTHRDFSGGTTEITIGTASTGATTGGAVTFDSGSGFLGYVAFQESEGTLGTLTAVPLVFKTTNTERLRILAGGGLTFNGDTAAANALDDYEEGTATLTLSSTATAPTIEEGNTFTIAYTKIGNLVRFVGYTGARNVTDIGTGVAKITGLPFTQAGAYYGQVTFAHSTLFNGNVSTGYIEAGNTFFYPILLDSTSTAVYRSATRFSMVQGFYHTA
jgi:hypothetical protein